MNIFTMAMGGEAGYGINITGLNFSKIATRSGYDIFNYFEYPSIIRGGHTLFRCTFSDSRVYSAYSGIDLLVAMNQESMKVDTNFLNDGAYIIYDPEQVKILPSEIRRFRPLEIPLLKMAAEKGNTLLRNTIALGAMCAIFEVDPVLMREIISEGFGNKDEKVKIQNIKAVEAGYEYAVEHFKPAIKPLLKRKKKIDEKLVITGNESAAFGAISAGMQFASIYPMTPITNILHTLAPLQNEYEFVYKQPEDEISAVNMAIGASFAGVRSMTATSGGGYCLMTEGIGLAGMTETPLVIIEGMRGGPSTGLPTWTEQPDLRFVLNGNHGDIPKIVLTAGDIEDTYQLVFDAFNLAEKYQTPVIVVVDKHICESHMSIFPFKDPGVIERGKYSTKSLGEYLRYANAKDGISLRAPAGSPNHVLANSDEHDENGYTSDDALIRDLMMKKRMKKMETCAKESMKGPVLYGPKDASLTLVAWGSTKGAVLEAMKQISDVNLLYFTWMNPFPVEQATQALKKAKKLLNIEGNCSAQLGGLIAENTGIRINDNLLKFDGRPFFVEELILEIKKRLV